MDLVERFGNAVNTRQHPATVLSLVWLVTSLCFVAPRVAVLPFLCRVYSLSVLQLAPASRSVYRTCCTNLILCTDHPVHYLPLHAHLTQFCTRWSICTHDAHEVAQHLKHVRSLFAHVITYSMSQVLCTSQHRVLKVLSSQDTASLIL